jgi:hypothetical protein
MLKSAGALLFLLAVPAATQAPRVAVDPRVELLSVIFRLAGNTEYTQGRVPIYNAAIDKWFAPFKDHEAIQLARQFRDRYGVGFDAPMSLAANVKDVQTLEELIPVDSAASRLDKRWHGAEARPFLEAARRFVKDTKFQDFMDSQKELYECAAGNMRALVEKEADFTWFEKFFGMRAGSRFFVVPALVNGPSNYGSSIRAADGVDESNAVIGVWDVDQSGMPTFQKGTVGTVVHEVVHSYANPLIAKVGAQIEDGGDKIFQAVRPAMQRQAYATGGTVLRESLVRACSARYALAHGGELAAKSAIAYERGRFFFWTGELYDLLGEYEQDRSKYPTLEAFMPRVAEFFNRLGPRVKGMADAFEVGRPKIVSITPANGAQDVDPGLTQIVVKFDRPMRNRSWEINKSNPALWPKLDRVGYDDGVTVFTMAVKLEPAHDYEFTLNDSAGGSFQSAEGVPLPMVRVKFRSRP